MTLAEFKALADGKAEIDLSPLEWDELEPHANSKNLPGEFYGEVAGVRIRIDRGALKKWQQARKDDAKRELERRAALKAHAESAAAFAEGAAAAAKAAKEVSRGSR